jgi:hypothetical protein
MNFNERKDLVMKRFPLLTLLAGLIFVLAAAGSAEAQSCFECVQQAGSNPDRPNWYCRGGEDFSACTTASNYDPNTCVSYTTCNNVYACTTDPGNGGDYCSNSSCDSNQRWEINTLEDLQDYMCYHFGSWCW